MKSPPIGTHATKAITVAQTKVISSGSSTAIGRANPRVAAAIQ